MRVHLDLKGHTVTLVFQGVSVRVMVFAGKH